MNDSTEQFRRAEVARINGNPSEREALEATHGQIWSTDELTTDFEALSFLAPYIVVKRVSDGIKGTLEFQHSPRFYYNFQPE